MRAQRRVVANRSRTCVTPHCACDFAVTQPQLRKLRAVFRKIDSGNMGDITLMELFEHLDEPMSVFGTRLYEQVIGAPLLRTHRRRCHHFVTVPARGLTCATQKAKLEPTWTTC